MQGIKAFPLSAAKHPQGAEGKVAQSAGAKRNAHWVPDEVLLWLYSPSFYLISPLRGQLPLYPSGGCVVSLLEGKPEKHINPLLILPKIIND